MLEACAWPCSLLATQRSEGHAAAGEVDREGVTGRWGDGAKRRFRSTIRPVTASPRHPFSQFLSVSDAWSSPT